MLLLTDNIDKIKNIGEERTKKFHKLGVYTVENLIEYFPRDYEDRSNVVKIQDSEVNKINTVKGIIISKPEVTRIKNFQITRTHLQDDTGIIEIIWYNQPYLKNTIKVKSEYIMTGKITAKFGRPQMESPDFEIIGDNELLSNGRIVPVYSLTEKLSQKILRSIIKSVLEITYNQLEEFIPESVRKKYKLCDRNFAVENIHFPKNRESFFIARKRLVFEELFLLQLKLLQLKGNVRGKPSSIDIEKFDLDLFYNQLPFSFTNAQSNVLNEILTDFKNKLVMSRLVQGDVGSGKTAVAMAAAYVVIINGYQCALMAPTDVLAEQHYNSFKQFFSKLGISCVLLSGSLRKKEKTAVYEQITDGSAQMIIGTHAVIQEGVIFKNLGLVITDEQHRFGVRQRNILSEKGNNPHVLVMTATPIPRTLALILYGDLDISIIDELPPGRKPIDTIAVNSSYYERVYNFIKKNADSGHQSYIICPMIEENEKLELKAVIAYTEKLKSGDFKDYTIECIHGKMKSTVKQSIMNDFAKGKIDVLVSTTVIEVGINVPNATIMLIENAERFGLAQLHQLRGRVGRGADKSYCILLSDSKSKISKERFKTMVQFSDGFKISEKDLELRGPGDFFGTRQHGLPELKIANLYKDIDILKLVQSAAAEIYNSDPELKNVENSNICMKMNEFFCKSENIVSL